MNPIKPLLSLSAPLESVENPETGRYTIFPIARQWDYDYYKKAREVFWIDEEIDEELAKDSSDLETLDEPIRNFIEHILAFFAVSDGVVNETLTESILQRVEAREVKLWYDFQIMMEDIHNITYSKLIDVYVKDRDKRHRLLNAVEYYPTIRRKIEWVHKWLGKDNEIHQLSDETKTTLIKLEEVYGIARATQQMLHNFEDPFAEKKDDSSAVYADIEQLFTKLHEPRPALAQQILINTIMEGVFFSGSFCAIFWIFNHYKKLPGLAKSNEWISRDEGMHTVYGVGLYRSLKHKLSESAVHDIIDEAVAIESDFINDALPQGLLGMNANLMLQYIKFVADGLLIGLGYRAKFHTENPFPFMVKQSISVRMGDFFNDMNISEYGLACANISADDLNLDFTDF